LVAGVLGLQAEHQKAEMDRILFFLPFHQLVAGVLGLLRVVNKTEILAVLGVGR
jgi:hypothetical protein